jgi:hypothetical protein
MLAIYVHIATQLKYTSQLGQHAPPFGVLGLHLGLERDSLALDPRERLG